MRAFWMACAAAGLLSACVVAEGPVTGPAPGPDACGASGFKGLVGQRGSVLIGIALPEGTRVLRPGMPMTTDFRPDRLNIELDRNDRIARVFCS